MTRRNREHIGAFLSSVRVTVERHKAAQMDASGRVLCEDCGGSDPTCFWCDGSGYIDDIGTVDAEDVRR